MKRLSLYLTPSRSSVTIENGASRETCAASLSEMLNHMHAADAAVLHNFCTVVLAHLDRPEGAAVLVNALCTETH